MKIFSLSGPLYSATVLFDNWFIGFMDAVFQITFLSAVTLFNICVYHALRQVSTFILFHVLGNFLIFYSYIEVFVLLHNYSSCEKISKYE